MTDSNPSSDLNHPKTGRFVKGNPGRPRGSKNKITSTIENMMNGEAEEITRQCIDLAKKGDPTALKIVMDRIAPIRKGRSLTGIKKYEDESSTDAILRAVLEGEITPQEGKDVVSLIEGAAKVAAHKALSELRRNQVQLIKEANELGGGVMIVPPSAITDDWGATAIESQVELKKTVRD